MNLRSILLACLAAAAASSAAARERAEPAAAARGTVARQICQNVPGCEVDPDQVPTNRRRLGPASPPQTLPQPLNRRNLRFGYIYKEDVFCPEGCKLIGARRLAKRGEQTYSRRRAPTA